MALAAGAAIAPARTFGQAPRRAAAYVDRIFKGANPAEVPIKQPDTYDLVVDLNAARKLKLTIPRLCWCVPTGCLRSASSS